MKRKIVYLLLFSGIVLIIFLAFVDKSKERKSLENLTDYIGSLNEYESITVVTQSHEKFVLDEQGSQSVCQWLTQFKLPNSYEVPLTKKYNVPGVEFQIELSSPEKRTTLSFVVCRSEEAILRIFCNNSSQIIIGEFNHYYMLLRENVYEVIGQ